MGELEGELGGQGGGQAAAFVVWLGDEEVVAEEDIALGLSPEELAWIIDLGGVVEGRLDLVRVRYHGASV